MKRSEMLKNINDYLQLDLNIDMEPEWIEEILNIVEKAGMAAPVIRNPKLPKEMCRFALAGEQAKYSVYGYEGPYYGMKYDVRQWEEETDS